MYLFNRLNLGLLLWGFAACAPLQGSDLSSESKTASIDFSKLRAERIIVTSLSADTDKATIDYNRDTKQASFVLNFQNQNDHPFVLEIRLLLMATYRINQQGPRQTEINPEHLIDGQKFSEMEVGTTASNYFAIMPGKTTQQTFSIDLNTFSEEKIPKELKLVTASEYSSTSSGYAALCGFWAYEYRRYIGGGLIVFMGGCLLLWAVSKIAAWSGCKSKAPRKNNQYQRDILHYIA